MTTKKSTYSKVLELNSELKKEKSLFGFINLINTKKTELKNRVDSIFEDYPELKKEEVTIDYLKLVLKNFKVNKNSEFSYLFTKDSKKQKTDRKIFSPVMLLKAITLFESKVLTKGQKTQRTKALTPKKVELKKAA